jgi:hypothetical protein
MMLTLLAIVTAMIAAISMLLVLRYRPPKKDEAAILYAKFATRVGVSPAIGETPQAYARRIRDRQNGIAEITDEITAQYLQTRYGPHNPDMLQQLRNLIKRFSPGQHSTE